jgi:glycine/D-amino acid oxidase-like deaminating enzyme
MLDDSVGYRKYGSLLLESSSDGVAALRESAALLAEDGFSARLLTAAEREQESGSMKFGEALLSPEDGCVDPVRLVNRLAAASGAQRVTGAIESVEGVKGGVLLQGPALEIRAKRAFLALNAWSSQVAPELAGWTRPRRAQMLATEPLPPLWNRVIYADSGYQYLRQLDDGTCLIGGGRLDFADEEVGLEAHVHPRVHDFLESYVRERFPALRDMKVAQRWAGIMAFSPDGVPVMGELSRAPGTWFLGGYTGHGMGFAFRLSKMLVAHVLEGGGMGPFGAGRFS